MKALTKEQLEELGFTVRERQLKKGLKLEIYWDGCYGDYIGYYDKYPSFRDIIGNVVKEVEDESGYNTPEEALEAWEGYIKTRTHLCHEEINHQ